MVLIEGALGWLWVGFGFLDCFGFALSWFFVGWLVGSWFVLGWL